MMAVTMAVTIGALHTSDYGLCETLGAGLGVREEQCGLQHLQLQQHEAGVGFYPIHARIQPR